MIILIIPIIVSYDQNISLIFLCERWIPCQALTSVLCLHCRPETVHCSTKDMNTSEITFLALHPRSDKAFDKHFSLCYLTFCCFSCAFLGEVNKDIRLSLEQSSGPIGLGIYLNIYISIYLSNYLSIYLDLSDGSASLILNSKLDKEESL